MLKHIVILAFWLLGGVCAYSQEYRTEIIVDFRMNSTQIEPEFNDNTLRISQLISFLHQVQSDSSKRIVNISFCGAASPDGSYEWNRQLAKGRMMALEKVLRSKVVIPDSLISHNDSYIPWDYLASMVEQSGISHRSEILKILSEKQQIVPYYDDLTIDRRILRLKSLGGGKVWKEMIRRFFIPMRNAAAVFVTFKHVPPVVAPIKVIEDSVTTDTVAAVEHTPISVDSIPVSTPVVEKWGRNLYVKTNALGWGVAIANAAIEIDLYKHLSFNLPVYYSAWNYLTSTIKFRTFAIQPEIRYWFSDKNDGWFIGGHFGLAYYNIAIDRKYRIQDHNGKSPALGGGIAAGYRMPISSNNRWKMEFSIGAGAYSLHYDKFHNHKNGEMISSKKKTYIGLDQAAVSFSYTFDLKRNGGVK